MTTMTAPLSILIADDTEPLLLALADLIGDEPELDVVGLATDGRQAVADVLAVRPDVIVLDMRMPELDGLHAAREILAAWPAARVILHSAYADQSLVDEAVGLGVLAYLVKSRDPYELVDFLIGLARERNAR